MKEKRIYHKARMFSVELSNKTQLLSESSVSVSGTNSTTGGLMHGSYHNVFENPFE